MSYSYEAADQIVRMSLNGIEVAAKISGKAAERLAVLLYAVLKDQRKTSGKIRLTNMLKSGKELKVFAIRDNELQKFCEEAKKYGVLYCILKDNKANDGVTDIMVRAEDASKVNRIFERYKLSTIDMTSLNTDISKTVEEKADESAEVAKPSRADSLNKYLESITAKAPVQTEEAPQTENPIQGRTVKYGQSVPSSETRNIRYETFTPELSTSRRPSVRETMNQIRIARQPKKAEKSRTKSERASSSTKKKVVKEATV